MIKFGLFVLAVVWLVSYVKFRRRYRVEEQMCAFTREKHENERTPMSAVEYGCALMQCQQYRAAVRVLESVLASGAGRQFPFLTDNIEFCRKPLPWSNGAFDYVGGSWWHWFLLKRFGGRRQVAISEGTALAFNSSMRMLGR